MATVVYPSERALAIALRAGSIPVDVVSPGYVAQYLGVSRQAVWDRVNRGTLDCWRTKSGSIVLIGVDKVKRKSVA